MTSPAAAFAFLTDDPVKLEKILADAGHVPPVHAIVRVDEAGLAVRDTTGVETLWHEPDMGCAGLIAFAPALCGRVSAWWLERSGEALAVFQPSGRVADRRNGLLAWLARRSCEHAGIIARLAAGTASQNRQLRRSYTALQRNFAKLESLVAAQNLDLRRLLVQTDAPDAYWAPANANQRLRQILPALQSQCAAISLYFSTPQPVASEGVRGSLSVRLLAEPAGREIACWVIPYGDVRDGANVLDLPGHGDIENEVTIEVEWSSARHAPRIALSPPHWNTPYYVDTAELKAERRSLCAEIWSGPVGARQPARLDGVAAALQGNRRAPEVFGPEIVLQAREYSYAGSPSRSHPLVQISGQRLVVHPASSWPTIAVLPRRVPLGATAMRIDCRTLHHQASAIDYCVVACEKLAGIQDVLQTSRSAGANFAGWKRLRAGQGAVLTLEFDAPVSSALNICLATRLPAGSQEAYAWASFGDVLFFRGDYTLEDYLRDHEVHQEDDAFEDQPDEMANPQIIYAQSNFNRGFSAGLQDKGAQFRRQDAEGPLALGANDLFSATLCVNAQTPDYGEDSVFAVDGEWLMVHAHGPAPTIAVINSVIPEGIRRMSVSCQTIEGQAGEIEYAAAIVSDGEAPFDFIQADECKRSGFSGWMALPPLKKAEIGLQLDGPSRGDEVICLATRLAPGASDAHCWSCFGQVIFHFDGDAAEGSETTSADVSRLAAVQS